MTVDDSLGIGVIEGFFGPPWPWSERGSFCDFLELCGGEFYVYAPKRDGYLRKNWGEDHPEEIWGELRDLSSRCRARGLKFGMGLSPFELHMDWNSRTKDRLREKVKKLEDIGVQILGLFFDDMRGGADLAGRQAEIVGFVETVTDRKILFCPTYYSDDPILDKVFGARPVGYLEELGKSLSPDVMICWTGSKVIPDAISQFELNVISEVLQRKPVIWENYFANDGPNQCKFLKLKPLGGRSSAAFRASSGWALNLMNQANLSKVVFLAALGVLRDGLDPEASFEQATRKLLSGALARDLAAYKALLGERGLGGISETARGDIRCGLDAGDRFAREVIDWLDGRYLVGPECLTD